MGFEKFSSIDSNKRLSNEVSVTNSAISLPEEFVKGKYAELFFDKVKKLVGIKFLKEKTNDCFSLQENPNKRLDGKGVFTINATRLIKMYEIKKQRYKAKEVNGMLVFEVIVDFALNTLGEDK